jgi:rhodanese-related sulfurtransferase/transcriptional regulator with XRE-family HTH domain
MVKTIGPREATALLARGGVDVVDVREPEEWATGHLRGARLVPLGRLRADFGAAGVKDSVLFVCAKGGRSMTAAELAVARGIRDVYSLEGGTAGWNAEGLPVEVPGAPSPAAPPAAASAEGPSATNAAEEAPSELDAVVGGNVRELRKQRGLTLDLLAGLSGVGRQALGQIELGRTVPSVATLWKIAKAFEVPFSALLAKPGAFQTRVLRHATASRLVSGDGRFSSRALFPLEQKGSFELYELWLAGHGREDAEAHAPGTRENLVVTTGRLVLEIGKERHELGKGDAIVFAADVPHAYVNPASDECWMNLVMSYA